MQVAELQQTNKGLRERIAAVIEQVGDAKKKLEVSESELGKTLSYAASLEQQCSELIEHLNKMKEKCDLLTSKNKALLDLADKYRSQVEQHRNALQRIEQYGYEVNKFQHSTRVLFDAVGVQFDDGTDEFGSTSYDVQDDTDEDFGEF